jgi:hypothetical protein
MQGQEFVMERGVYFDAWFPRQHCYHPSLPPRRLRMIDDLVDYRSTVLVWSALGGGSISLPWLEQEAWGEIDPRFRFYGFVNDAEFIAACQRQGIKVFGIVFEVQGWEFPVELNDAEDRVLAVNELRGEGKRDWIGLREFSQDRYPGLWPPFERYFPGGLVNSAGEPVTDLLEECCSRDIHGEPCHAHWVECPDCEHFCYTMDRNNPVWREYLKAVIRIQIDAGVDGVQLDEAELPLTSLQYGGCFCRDCMTGFREHLGALPTDAMPEELRDIDLAAFHYGDWLKAQGYYFKSRREETPLYWEYIRYQRRAITRYFAELADYARAYAAERGRNVLVSGNFFNVLDQYYALEPKVDMIITEMRNTRFRQPEWYRYVAGFAGAKPVVVVENPYGGVVPELVDMLRVGKRYDRFRQSLYEGAALGANMSVPYGAWMGSVVQDAFYPPHELTVEIQAFLADRERLFSRRTWNDTAVVYSVESNFYGGARPDEIANNTVNRAAGKTTPFWEACGVLAGAAQPYDVVFLPDGELRPDALEPDDFAQYRRVVLPGCHHLTARQADVLAEYLDRGGTALILGDVALNLPDAERARIAGHANAWNVTDASMLAADPHAFQVTWEPAIDAAINLMRVDEGVAVHIIRYDFCDAEDRVPKLDALTVTVRLQGAFDRLTCHDPHRAMTGTVDGAGDVHTLTLRDVPLYSIAHLTRDA